MSRVYNPEFLYLTTTGWKSGAAHEIEIWYVAYKGCCYLCAERRERTHWVQNIQHEPRVSFWVTHTLHNGQARVITPSSDPETHAAISRLFDQKYNWSDGLMVEVRPEAER